MKVKIGELLKSRDSLNWLGSQPAGGRAAMMIARLARQMSGALADYEAARQKLLKQFEATLPEGAQKYVFPDGKEAEFAVEHKALFESEIELQAQPIPWSLVEGLEWMAVELMALDWAIMDDAPAPKG